MRTTVPAKPVRRADVVVYRPRSRRSRWSFAPAPPTEIVVVDSLAVAVYADDHAVQYSTLAELLGDHGFTRRDLVRITDERPSMNG